MEKGWIFNISRFCIDDGPGIRSTVFLKGCPLHCAWCHNPESQKLIPEIAYYRAKCTFCGKCMMVCPGGCHRVWGADHVFERKNCTACGLCAGSCNENALKLIGKQMNVLEVMKKVLADRVFYEASNGGVTISGGEPMFQPNFTFALAQNAKEKGIHVCIETSGFCKSADLAKVVSYTDLFLYDYKCTGGNLKKYTGVTSDLILFNLKMLDEMGAAIVLRCPIIPDVNMDDEHIQAVMHTALGLKNIKQIDLMPYHPLGATKSLSLGREAAYKNMDFMDKSELMPHAKRINRKTGITVNVP